MTEQQNRHTEVRWIHTRAKKFLTLGPKTRKMVTVVLSCVRRNPKKYFISGPQFGKRTKLEKQD